MVFEETKLCALSSTETEYIAASSDTQEVLWLLTVFQDFDLEQTLPILIDDDNISYMKVIQ